jgi:hypothetical protein
MTGAAIASAGMSVVNGIGARKDAKAAGQRADQEAAMSAEQRAAADKQMGVSIDTYKENKGQVNDLQNFLNDMSAEGVEYAQGLMDDWEGSFGSVQDNLTSYFNNLDPDKYSTEQKARLGDSMQKSLKQYDETMAAGGLQSAGMRQQTAKEPAFRLAEGNAEIDLAAEDQVANMKMDWLNYGKADKNQANQAMGTALDKKAQFGQAGYKAQMDYNTGLSGLQKDRANFTSGQAATTQGIADKYGQSAALSSAAAGNHFGNAMKSGLTAYNSYNNNNGLGVSDAVGMNASNSGLV